MLLTSPRSLFYFVNREQHSYATMAEVPPFVSDAIPWFVILIIVELIVSALQGVERYNLKETLCSFSLGIVSQICGIPLQVLAMACYAAIYEHLRLFTVPYDSALCWWALVLGVDLGYYWLHRYCHEFHSGWLGHSVHHSGQFYNFATALRQGTAQGGANCFFYLPLALLGLPQPMFVAHKSFNLLYQYWIHTEAVCTRVFAPFPPMVSLFLPQ